MKELIERAYFATIGVELEMEITLLSKNWSKAKIAYDPEVKKRWEQPGGAKAPQEEEVLKKERNALSQKNSYWKKLLQCIAYTLAVDLSEDQAKAAAENNTLSVLPGE